MQFKVPEAVFSTIANYDPEAPKMKKPQSKVVRNTLGIVNDLFPIHLIPADTQLQWALELNRYPIEQRYITFYSDVVSSVIFVEKGVWCGVWHSKIDASYLFGMSVVYRASDASLQKLGTLSTGYSDSEYSTLQKIAPFTEVKYGKVAMRKHSFTITQNDLIKWEARNLPCHQTFKSNWSHVNTLIHSVLNAKSIPFWKADRTTEKDPFRKMIDLAHPVKFFAEYLKVPGVTKETTFEQLFNAAYPHLSEVLSTPFFKKESARFYSESLNVLGKSDYSYQAIQFFNHFVREHHAPLSIFNKIYGDSNLDYYQQLWKNESWFVRSLNEYFIGRNSDAIGWIKENVPIKSFLNMADSYSSVDTLRDTIDMIQTILSKGGTVSKPKRWRLCELHDQVSETFFTIGTPNVSLPQDLFPSPIRTENYTFLQPEDTHQLIRWGKAARNCVGNAKHYAESVKSKKEFIVLAMKNTVPCFTIQLRVMDGMLEVRQIVGMCNSPLSDVEKYSYTQEFNKALLIREEQLSGNCAS
jgi:hypothetical protein